MRCPALANAEKLSESLYDMLDVPDDMKGGLLQATLDYQMNLIDARHMTKEQINEFEGDLKAFLLMLQERYDEELERGIYMDATLDYIEKRGKKLGVELAMELHQRLDNDGRLDEWDNAIRDMDIMIGLLEEYALLDDV